MKESSENKIKSPEYSGLFYPSDHDEFEKQLELTLAEVATLGPNYSDVPIRALITPSAGFSYAAKTALKAYQQIINRHYNKVIILGASHFVSFEGVAMTAMDAYSTYDTITPVDKASVKYLQTGFDFHLFEDAFSKEYSIEMQLPYLHYFLKDFTVLPLIVGTKLNVTATAMVISDLIDDDTLVIVSTNLSHFHADTKALSIDQKTIDAILTKDTDQIKKVGQASAIQSIAILNEIALLKEWQPVFLGYDNSSTGGDDADSVVGYASFLYFQGS